MAGWWMSRRYRRWSLAAWTALLCGWHAPRDAAAAECEAQPSAFERVGTLDDRVLPEVSGMARGRRNPDRLWVHNDSQHPARIHAIDGTGRLRASFAIGGATNLDWEDMASFELEGTAYLLIADTGDNFQLRPVSTLYIVAEPALPTDEKAPNAPPAPSVPRARKSAPGEGDGPASLPVAWRIDFHFAGGARDCEAVAVDGAWVYLLTKRVQPPRLYRLPLRPGFATARLANSTQPPSEGVQGDSDGGRAEPSSNGNQERARPPQPLEAALVGTLPPTPPVAKGKRAYRTIQPTAMDIDSASVAVLFYDRVHLYPRRAGETAQEAVARPARVLPLPRLPQCEALTIAGKHLYITTEQDAPPLLRAELP